MKMAPNAQILRVTYLSSNKDRDFDVMINDQKIAHVAFKDGRGEQFFNQDYEIPASIRPLKEVLVKFVAAKGSKTADVFDVRVLK